MSRVFAAHPATPEVLDVVGVGFGPSNLAVGIAAEEHGAVTGTSISTRFVERQDRFGWHRGMLLADATMQVSYLKDLATLRNPASRFGFLTYLHERGRLVDFINYGSPFPTRIEFHDYLEWAAAAFDDRTSYGTQALGIRPVRERGQVDRVEVTCRNAVGDVVALQARNVVLATGLTPNLPEGITLGERIWHNRDLLGNAAAIADARPKRFVVVGAGQSAAETVDHLHRTFADAEVYAVFGRYGYSPADDSSFANRIFDPAAVDDFYGAPDEVKASLMAYHGNTNYSVVDPDLIEALYRTHYHENVAGRPRLRFRNVSRVSDVVASPDRVTLAIESLIDGTREMLEADAVVFATGYRSTDPTTLIDAELAAACVRDDAGRLAVGRDYRLETADLPDGTPVHAGIYVQGATEHTHGISSTLLSNVAVRSGEIVASIAAARQADRAMPSAVAG